MTRRRTGPAPEAAEATRAVIAAARALLREADGLPLLRAECDDLRAALADLDRCNP